MNAWKTPYTLIARAAVALSLAVLLKASALASDPESGKKKWQLDSGLDRARFRELVKERSKEGMRLVDFELYRIARNTQISAIWVEARGSEKWEIEEELTFDTFREKNELYLSRGYALADLEVDRVGATLEFSAVWLKSPLLPETHGYFGMDSLLFSNRYGEMADNGFRLIDFEAYEGNGQLVYAGIWAKRKDETVRFYRGLELSQFESIAKSLKESGFRLIDIEAYEEGKRLSYAGEWAKMAANQRSEYAVNLPTGEFFQKNMELTQQGYRLVEIDMIEVREELRYAGSWLRDLTEAEMPVPEKGSFLDEFRK